MSRPRDPKIPTKKGVCKVHGVVDLRGHAIGNGSVRWRCLQCHNDYNHAHPETGAITRAQTAECTHPDKARDPDRDEDWCLAYRCPKCGLETIEARS